MEEIKKVKFQSKEECKELPVGSKVLSKEKCLEVCEIENGFILKKCCNIKYETKDGMIDWICSEKKYYSKENPIQIDEKPLADKFAE